MLWGFTVVSVFFGGGLGCRDLGFGDEFVLLYCFFLVGGGGFRA